MSVVQKTQRSAVALSSARICSRELALRASATTRYPSCAKVSTKRAPMPGPTPATTATLSFAIFFPFSFLESGRAEPPYICELDCNRIVVHSCTLSLFLNAEQHCLCLFVADRDYRHLLP